MDGWMMQRRRELLDRIKNLEYQGYELEAAEGTFELLVREAMNPGVQLFEVVHFEVTTKMDGAFATATVGQRDRESARGRIHCDSEWARSDERAR